MVGHGGKDCLEERLAGGTDDSLDKTYALHFDGNRIMELESDQKEWEIEEGDKGEEEEEKKNEGEIEKYFIFSRRKKKIRVAEWNWKGYILFDELFSGPFFFFFSLPFSFFILLLLFIFLLFLLFFLFFFFFFFFTLP